MTTLIAKKREHIETSFAKLRKKLADLQNECQHPNVTKKYHSNGGSWDTYREYWTVFDCPDCGKNWTVDGSK